MKISKQEQGKFLSDKLNNSDNSLNFIRLVLASIVIFGHAFPLGGFQPFTAGIFHHGGWHGTAVEAFFVISGYLILASALRLRLRSYLWRRFLRIYPGYVAAIFATSFIFAPIVIIFGGNYDFGQAVYSFFRSLTLKNLDLAVGADVPWGNAWNVSIWTLFYEALAYLMAAVIALLPALRNNIRMSTGIITGIFMVLYILPSEVYAVYLPGSLGGILENFIRLGVFFSWGMVAYAWAHKIKVNVFLWVILGICIIFYLSVDLGGSIDFLFPAVLTYFILCSGCILDVKIGSTNDISYGLYVYASPVQQALILAGVAQLGWFMTAFTCLIVTIPIAWFSWKFIEKPAMSLKSKF